MRKLVEPPPSTRCSFCDGELLLMAIKPDDPTFDIEVQEFVCANCGQKHSRKVIHDPYTAHTAEGMPPRHGQPAKGVATK
jgi:hypothetical protein